MYLFTSISSPQVLAAFKSLHRVAQAVFAGDEVALEAARVRISEDFRKNKNVQNTASVSELLKFAKEVESELQTSVVQAKEKTPGVYGKRQCIYYVYGPIISSRVFDGFCRIDAERNNDAFGQCDLQRSGHTSKTKFTTGL